jgi:hypothetical protein
MSEGAAAITAIIAAITALFAVVLGPLVSLWSTNRQSRVTVLSANRQAWINGLREALAELISVAGTMSLIGDKPLLHTRVERLFLLDAKIRLMLNPVETDHQQLAAAVASVRIAGGNTLRSTAGSPEEKALNDSLTTLVPLAQRILKREWERVKKIE